MMKQLKFANMTEYQALELMHIAVQTVLEDVAKGRVIEGVPKLTEEQLEEISFESSFLEHRIKFYPEENRDITVSIRAEEYQYEEGTFTNLTPESEYQLILDTMRSLQSIMDFTTEQLFNFLDNYRPDYTTGNLTDPTISDVHSRYLSFFVHYGEFIPGFEAYYNYSELENIKLDYKEGVL